MGLAAKWFPGSTANFLKEMEESKKLGDIGERIAEKYLKGKGYKILDKNLDGKN